MAGDKLRALARLYGVSTRYVDVWRRRQSSSPAAVLRILQLLGAPIHSLADVPAALRARRQEIWQEMLEPVLVFFGNERATARLRLPEPLGQSAYECRLSLENGATHRFSGKVAHLPKLRCRSVENVSYSVRELTLPAELPRGYHRLECEVAGQVARSVVIVAPLRAWSGAPAARQAIWGVFLPLYALYRESSRGAGDFADLEALMQWTAEQGGNLVANLPLLATLWELTDDPSPYNPASRLFWNEFYLSVEQIPELATCGEARALLPSLPKSGEPGDRSGSRLIDYPAEMRNKRRVLEALAASFFSRPSTRRDELDQYCREHPELVRFAQFRAVGERQGCAWPGWPEPVGEGVMTEQDYDRGVFEYHLYTQWQVEQQLDSLKHRADHLRLLWYLDFPLGVNGGGYDVWENRELFVRDASGGAPPDSFFTRGQNWGFPPMHPGNLRQQGYAYFIRALRNHLRHARVLRFDHVMGLQRLYWIPHGFPAHDGAYVRYPLNEMCAILTLESHRFAARIVGENLGTVPVMVDEALERHGLDDMYVLQYETNPEKGPTLRRVPETSVASVNTHDMPQFAAYWQGLDVEDRLRMGLFTPAEADEELARREQLRQQLIEFLRAEGYLATPPDDDSSVLQACQAFLAASDAGIVLINLEDLWGETEPQNRPGTYREYPNWRRTGRYAFDTFSSMDDVTRILKTVDQLRRGSNARPHTESDT